MGLLGELSFVINDYKFIRSPLKWDIWLHGIQCRLNNLINYINDSMFHFIPRISYLLTIKAVNYHEFALAKIKNAGKIITFVSSTILF